jgi:hypothetical protein
VAHGIEIGVIGWVIEKMELYAVAIASVTGRQDFGF